MNAPTKPIATEKAKRSPRHVAAQPMRTADESNIALQNAPLSKTAQKYLDKALDALLTVWDERETTNEKDAQREAKKHAQMTRIAKLIVDADAIKGTPQIRLRSIVKYLSHREERELVQKLMREVLKQSAKAAAFDHSMLNIGKLNPEVSAAIMAELAASQELAGNEAVPGTQECVFDRGETPPEQEAYAGTPTYEAIAYDVKDAEVACIEIQSMCSATYRISAKRPDGELLPLKIEPIEGTEPLKFKNYETFDEFIAREQEIYAEKNAQRMQDLANSITDTKSKEELDEVFDIEE